METLRKCSKCGEPKPATTDYFTKNKTTPSGLHNQCKACRSAYGKTRIKQGLSYNRAANKRWALKLRKDVLTHYSHGMLQCACCGETHIEFLALDHTNGGGNKHKVALSAGKTYRISGTAIYQWIRRNKYPEGFQVLCHNCNMAKGLYGQCPHKSTMRVG